MTLRVLARFLSRPNRTVLCYHGLAL